MRWGHKPPRRNVADLVGELRFVLRAAVEPLDEDDGERYAVERINDVQQKIPSV
jgi:hypothetical protein